MNLAKKFLWKIRLRWKTLTNKMGLIPQTGIYSIIMNADKPGEIPVCEFLRKNHNAASHS